MTLQEFIECLGKYKNQNAYVYLNYESNFEDDFIVAKSDANNILLIPKAKYEELKSSQEFDFIED